MIYTTVIDEFRDEYRWLSNFWVYDTTTGITVEHRYQAAKATNYEDWCTIMQSESPYHAKKLGKVLEVRPDWDIIKLPLMEEFVRDKFISNLSLRNKLLNTRGAFLIEGNQWGDTYWGVCNGVGNNHLGKILMRVRDEFFKNE